MAPKFCVIDDFLPVALLEAIAEQARANASAFELADFGAEPGTGAYAAKRRVWVHADGLGPLAPAFRDALMARFEDLCAGTGVAPFAVSRIEHEVCVQRDGSHFARHIDTDTRDAQATLDSDRIISAVFYFPAETAAFAGGDLLLHPFFAAGEPARIAPRRNRLAAFPSFAIHEVTLVTATDDTLDGARWSINCWLHRARAGGAAQG